jgi:hypothetical protein
MSSWKLAGDDLATRMELVSLRAMGDEEFTWAHLLYGKLGAVKIGIFYFPSRFDSATDKTVIDSLRAFGRNTGADTSVNIWDPKDPDFEQAMSLFGLKTVPAILLATGLKIDGMTPRGPSKTPLYSITLNDPSVLADAGRFQAAVNDAHEVLLRSDPKEIAGYIRADRASDILAAIGKVASRIRDEILKWKPKFGLPGGVSVQIG